MNEQEKENLEKKHYEIIITLIPEINDLKLLSEINHITGKKSQEVIRKLQGIKE